ALRRRRGAHLVVINLRILLAFAFLPAGVKKVLLQPFTDSSNHSRFHDFLHAFLATGWFYQFVGVLQLLVAFLLFSQRFTLAGAALALPIITAITAFTWSTAVPFTATVVTLMLLGVVALLLWELPRWRPLLDGQAAAAAELTDPHTKATTLVNLTYWRLCGLLIALTYLGLCIFSGGVYRPRPGAAHDAAFWIMSALPALPLATWIIEYKKYKRR
ncbi:MAG: hypothetical protein KBG15_11600, partial [Kofleriaceae bacterium]|nr:hypothetical protein [Kofleriaceae bacterium]